ncbi:MAG: EAL domain-containing protein [Atopobiaceae bacterium]|nr:EAL domain-containing protein [Atopobiaceae bacterium]
MNTSHSSSIDSVTGLQSLTRFFKNARTRAKHMRRQGDRPVALALDLVGMRTYNTRFGMNEGDRLLRNFARVLMVHFGTDYCTRYADDLFYAFAVEEEVTQKLPFVFDDFAALDLPGTLPVHAGAYVCDPDDDICDVGFHRARIACRLDSATLQSGLRWFTDEMRLEARLRLHVCAKLNQAIAEEWVRPLYQPIVRSATGEVCGAEALARWYDPRFGELMPEQFVPTLQEAGLSHTLDLYMVDCVLRDLLTMESEGLGLTPVSINISPFDFMHANMVEELVRRADTAGIPRNLIRIEIAESFTAYDFDTIRQHIAQIREAGFEVWLDDVGRGYTSLDALCKIDVDAVKLDLATMHGGMNRKVCLLVEGVIRTAQSLGVGTLAEGIETTDEVEYLERIGCDFLQGHFFARPLRLDVLMAHARIKDSMQLEPLGEQRYWNAVSTVDLEDLAVMDDTFDINGYALSQFPAGVVERREGTWRLLRTNAPYREFLQNAGLLTPIHAHTRISFIEGMLDKTYFDSIGISRQPNAWQRISGPIEYGSSFQYYARHIASVAHADAYLVEGIPTMLGTALGSYGDVPVAYAVFQVVLNDAGDEVVDTKYVYANDMYCEWLGLERSRIIGRSFLSAIDNASTMWFPYCYRAAILKEHIHDMVYSPEIGHWLSFNISPSPVEGHCVYAFSYADDERREREEIIERSERLERESMLDGLTGVLNRRGIDTRIEHLLRDDATGGRVERFALMLMDIDDFKTLNDVYGHDVGDEALRVIARTLVSVFPNEAVIGRNGGDEFLVMLADADANRTVEFIRALKSKELAFSLDDKRYMLSMSIGYVTYPDQVSSLREAYRKADAALYAVKLNGKGGCEQYRPEMETQYRSQLGFTPRDIAENIPGAIIVHKPGPDGAILFANNNLVKMFECDSLQDFLTFVDGVYGGIFHPDDVEHVRETLSRQTTIDDVGTHDYVDFRIVTKAGHVRHVAQNGHLVEVEGIGKVFYELLIDLDERRG